jgi:iron complex outermembrane receptor protein
VGNIDLKPETAYGGLHGRLAWRRRGGLVPARQPVLQQGRQLYRRRRAGVFPPLHADGRQGKLLQFANHDATLYGVNLAWQLPLARSSQWGSLTAGNGAWTRGKRSDGGDLYRMMPLNAVFAVEHRLGAWSSRIERSSSRARTRSMPAASNRAGYALVSVRSSVALGKMATLSAGVSNLFNRAHADPLGGIYLSGLKAQGGALQALPGEGRSIDVGLRLTF